METVWVLVVESDDNYPTFSVHKTEAGAYAELRHHFGEGYEDLDNIDLLDVLTETYGVWLDTRVVGD